MKVIKKPKRKTKTKQFRPLTICRYLAGELPDSMNLRDLYAHNCHLFRIFNAKPVVDCAPAKMNPYRIMPYQKMRDVLFRAYQIDKENKAMLNRLNDIHRYGGVLDTFNPKAYVRNTQRWYEHESDMKRTVKINKELYRMIIAAKPVYSKKEFDKSYKVSEERLKRWCRYAVVIGKKPDYDLLLSKEPSISFGLDKEAHAEEPVRSRCFLEFKVRDGPYLGKIIIELYEDYVPVTCQNFLEICKGEGELTYKDCVLHRIVKGKFIETGDITHNTGRGGTSIYGKTFPEEKHILRHTKAGVLSMKRIPYTENNSQFIITLTAMEQWDKMNVVFGKVIKGNGVLYTIQDYGRVIGKPYAEVYICKCGVVEPEEEEEQA